jgi:hypothetical protein
MAGREIGGNDEWRDLASVFSPMPSAAQFRSCNGRSYARSRSASNWLPVSMAAASLFCPSSGRTNGHREPERHEAVWRAVASRKGGWDNKRRNLATVPEGLPDAARLDDERAAAGRLCPGCTSAGSCAFSSADAIGFTVSVAAAGISFCWRCGVDRRRIRVAAAGSVSLSRINCRLGQ